VSHLPQPVELPVTERSSALPLRTQLVRFVLTGGLSALVDFGLLVLLMHGFLGVPGLGHTAAKALSFVAGTTTAYLINRRWTFVAEPSRRRFAAVVVLYALTFALQVGLFSLLFDELTAQHLPLRVVQLVGFVVAQGVATTVNFIVQRGVIFRLS
jgi:putative flippase GtrA